MEAYKRNQVEEAISRVAERGSTKPSSDLRTRIKRLLDTDRTLDLARGGRNRKQEAYAFFTGDPPGKGGEVWFSEYEAFALAVGLKLMEHGWPQRFAVAVMRRVREELEELHTITLGHDQTWLFDQEAIRRNAKEGDFAFNNQDPVLLTIVSKSIGRSGAQDEPFAAAACRGVRKAMDFARGPEREPGGAFTFFDVVGIAHGLSRALAQTTPRPRGRG